MMVHICDKNLHILGSQPQRTGKGGGKKRDKNSRYLIPQLRMSVQQKILKMLRIAHDP